jgi:hypothetical protein
MLKAGNAAMEAGGVKLLDVETKQGGHAQADATQGDVSGDGGRTQA